MNPRTLTAVAALAAALPATLTLAEHPRYRVEIIERVPGTYGISAKAINDQGQAVCYYGTQAFGDQYGYRVAVWTPGQGPAVDIGHPGNLVTVLPTDINNQGEITGFAADEFIGTATRQQAWRWRGGQFTLYPHYVTGRPTEPGLMNDAGRVVGWANDGSFTGSIAVEFATDGSLIDLMPNQVGYEHALDINNENQVLGTKYGGVFRWDLDTNDLVILPPPPEPYVIFEPRSLNDLGDVVGSARIAGHAEGRRAAVYLEGDGWRILPPVARRNFVVAINDARQAVGNSQDNAGARGDHAWIWSPTDGLVALEDLIEEPLGVYAVGYASDINESGQIACGLFNRVTGEGFAAVLTPIGITGGTNCPDVDFNQDGGADVSDIAAFFDAFTGAGTAPSLDPDLNADGGVDVSDISVFFEAFAGGPC